MKILCAAAALLALNTGCGDDTKPAEKPVEEDVTQSNGTFGGPGGKADDFREATSEWRNPNLIDRMGRPEITNFIIRVPPPKEGYNAADTFNLSFFQRKGYKTLFHLGISFWDGLDDSDEWSFFSSESDLAEVFVHDYLVVDTSKPCTVYDFTFLDIELSPVGEHTTCGGRNPNDDVVDKLVSVLIAGPNVQGRPYGDDIDGVPSPAENEFPFLAAPYAK